MVGLAAGLYTLRAVDDPLEVAIERVAAAGYDGVEFAFAVEEADPASVADALSRSGLAVTGAHVGPEFMREFDSHVARYRALGCPALVLSRPPDRHLGSSSAIAAGVQQLREDAPVVEEAGFDFLYHTHEREFERYDGELAFGRLVEGTESVGFVLDVGWVAAAGEDPVAVIETHGGRIPHLHVADVDADGRQVDLGEGIVDIAGCVRAARAAGVEWLVYEHDDPTDPYESIAEAATRLRSLTEGPDGQI